VKEIKAEFCEMLRDQSSENRQVESTITKLRQGLAETMSEHLNESKS
tara:strand:- start:786 stop:926 length:141 start_codon:yes stop_codon:yes gene_type:complete